MSPSTLRVMSPVWRQVGATIAVSPGSSTPLPAASTAESRGTSAPDSRMHVAPQPSPPVVSPSSQPSRPSRTLLPHVDAGIVPEAPALLRGVGGETMNQSALLLLVSSQASRLV